MNILYYLILNAVFYGLWFSLQINCEFSIVAYALKRRFSSVKGEK